MQIPGISAELFPIHFQFQRTQSRRSGVEVNRLFRCNPAAVLDPVQIDPIITGVIGQIDPGLIFSRSFQGHEILCDGQHLRQLEVTGGDFDRPAIDGQ